MYNYMYYVRTVQFYRVQTLSNFANKLKNKQRTIQYEKKPKWQDNRNIMYQKNTFL